MVLAMLRCKSSRVFVIYLRWRVQLNCMPVTVQAMGCHVCSGTSHVVLFAELHSFTCISALATHSDRHVCWPLFRMCVAA